MRVLYSGHRYELDNLDMGTTVLQFGQRAPLHPHCDGPTTQEVLRACIDRVKSLDVERAWSGNVEILHHLRCAIALFEARAVVRRVEKGLLLIEECRLGSDGHLLLSLSQECAA